MKPTSKTRKAAPPWEDAVGRDGRACRLHALGARLEAFTDPRLAALRLVVRARRRRRVARRQPAGRQDPPVRAVRHPGRATRAVLASFRQRHGLRMRVSDPVIGTLQSPGVTGLFTAEQALALLTGTAVGYRFTDGDAVRWTWPAPRSSWR